MTTIKQGTRYILAGIGAVALAIVLWQISNVVTVAFGGVVGAAVLRGLALPLGRATGIPEKWSLVIVVAALLGILSLFAVWFGGQVVREADEMQRLIPSSVDQLSSDLERTMVGRAVVTSVKRAPADVHTLSNVGIAAGAVLTLAADAVLVFFLSVYFAFTPREYLDGFLRLFPPPRRERIRATLVEAGDALLRWLLAQLAAMLVIGVLVGACLGVLGEPLALLLAVVAALLEFVPVVGPILFAIPGILVAFTKGPAMALYVFVAYLAVQQFESNVVIPLLQRWAVRLPPAITLLSVVIGGVLLGIPGVVFATPMAVVAMTLVKHLYVEDALERTDLHLPTGAASEPAPPRGVVTP